MHFEECQEVLFRFFETRTPELQTHIHPMLKAVDRKIGVSFKPENDLNKPIEKLSQLLEKMLKTMRSQLYVNMLDKSKDMNQAAD